MANDILSSELNNQNDSADAGLDECIYNRDDVQIYEDDVHMAIDEACAKYHIDNLYEEGQRRWKRVLAYVGKRIFADRKMLKSKERILYDNNIVPTNNDKYDTDTLMRLCDYYMTLSDEYDKLISLEGFSLFIGMARETLSDWGGLEPSSSRYRIYKKLKDSRLECLKDDAYDNGNVTGTMYVGNVEFGTNLPGVHDDKPRREALGADALIQLGQQPKPLELSDNSSVIDSDN